MVQVSDYTAILSGDSWAGADASQSPVFVTYSFETALQPHASDGGATQALLDSFRAFTNAEKNTARDALQQWSEASGLIFLEVSPGNGDISFGSYDFTLDPNLVNFTGYAFYPYVEVSAGLDYSYVSDIGGDVAIDYGDGTSLYLLLHEIGHALGFKHPFEGNPTLPKSLDNHTNTIMSYTGNYPDTLGVFDLQAVAAVYGDPGSGGSQVASWSWNGGRMILKQTGFDAGETILGVSVRDIVNGKAGDDLIAGFNGKDTLSGGEGGDYVYGGDGNDTLRGGKGNDHLYGEDGNDRFQFVRPSDGMDTIYWFGEVAGDNDSLRFDADAFGALGRGTDGLGVLKGIHFQASFSSAAANANVRFMYEWDTGILYYDPDGNGAAASTAVATFNNFPDLSAQDIILY